MRRVRAGFERALIVVEDFFALLSGLAVACMAILVVSEVVYRQIAGMSIQWAADLIQHYIMVTAFFLVLANAHRLGTHISLDVLVGRLPNGIQRYFGVGADLLALVLFAGYFWAALERTQKAFAFGDRGEPALPWMLGYSYLLMTAGFGLLLARIVFQLVTFWTSADIRSAMQRGSFETSASALDAGKGGAV